MLKDLNPFIPFSIIFWVVMFGVSFLLKNGKGWTWTIKFLLAAGALYFGVWLNWDFKKFRDRNKPQEYGAIPTDSVEILNSFSEDGSDDMIIMPGESIQMETTFDSKGKGHTRVVPEKKSWERTEYGSDGSVKTYTITPLTEKEAIDQIMSGDNTKPFGKLEIPNRGIPPIINST